MKRFKILLLCCLCVISFCSCKQNSKYVNIRNNTQEMRAVWISCYEFNIKNLTERQFKEKADTMLDNIATAGLNTVILHIRANADTIYKSEIFPWADTVTSTDGQPPAFDPLEYMTVAAHERFLELHAWINPFRVSNSTDDITSLKKDHIARIWYESDETENRVIPYNGKIYFNPASAEVRRLLLDSVREIAENYDIDGIHIDDYFYPTADEGFDALSYTDYLKSSTSPLSLTEWRSANIGTAVSEIYKYTSSVGIKLGISPSAHIGEEYITKNGYADVVRWLSVCGYADYIMPQIYWGFQYEDASYRFESVLKKWAEIQRNENIRLCPGLAAYKSGTEDTNDEWIVNGDIIKRQIELLREKECDGFALFSYSYLFSENQQNRLEKENLISLLTEKTALN